MRAHEDELLSLTSSERELTSYCAVQQSSDVDDSVDGDRRSRRLRSQSNASRDGSKSPFFAPSTPRVVQSISSPGGTVIGHERVLKDDVDEHKSTIFGTYANLVNVVVGAGIVGIPYAIRETGLVAGSVMVILVAVMTEKSLRLLIETGKHANVLSYETLMECAFGSAGFVFISVNMFIMAYGAMMIYLIIIKQTVPMLFGVADDNLPLQRSILALSTLSIILPLSCQRDMADLDKTSGISVMFDVCIVLLIAVFAPIQESIESSGGIKALISHSELNPKTFFTGLGVLSFAFVCQDSSFIIAGSLSRPTKKRWAQVTRAGISTCTVLALLCGTCGFLGWGEETQGNILNNFTDPRTERAANVGRALLGTTMFFVYPLASYVARHVCIVLFFRGRRAHDGDDHTVLARRDRRLVLTTVLYLLALIPALFLNELGVVLAVTGAIGGSCLSYIGPGVIYLAIFGVEFFVLITQKWGSVSKFLWNYPLDRQRFRTNSGSSMDKLNIIAEGRRGEDVGMPIDDEAVEHEKQTVPWCGDMLSKFILCVAWYALLMPLWCPISSLGQEMFKIHRQKDELKSPRPNRISGDMARRKLARQGSKNSLLLSKKSKEHLSTEGFDRDGVSVVTPYQLLVNRSISDPALGDVRRSAIRLSGQQEVMPSSYGASDPSTAGNKGIGAAISRRASSNSVRIDDPDSDTQDETPVWSDFVIAVGYIMFGVVAMVAGIVSIFAA
eukprot:CAMPEP_0198288892 /NCGR_PEP_ID=MMETSP1449-20131203/7254_1 /TAXON_ID=420275 /ORGANISM="Attheya septentrionalis, Strain CCMP2084" /LENGTH=727 /DNA_ID=CAMNT_0043987129 /DNA_START=228 /DNA_END=2411 /DNA_ORIENTATION=-